MEPNVTSLVRCAVRVRDRVSKRERTHPCTVGLMTHRINNPIKVPIWFHVYTLRVTDLYKGSIWFLYQWSPEVDPTLRTIVVYIYLKQTCEMHLSLKDHIVLQIGLSRLYNYLMCMCSSLLPFLDFCNYSFSIKRRISTFQY